MYVTSLPTHHIPQRYGHKYPFIFHVGINPCKTLHSEFQMSNVRVDILFCLLCCCFCYAHQHIFLIPIASEKKLPQKNITCPSVNCPKLQNFVSLGLSKKGIHYPNIAADIVISSNQPRISSRLMRNTDDARFCSRGLPVDECDPVPASVVEALVSCDLVATVVGFTVVCDSPMPPGPSETV